MAAEEWRNEEENVAEALRWLTRLWIGRKTQAIRNVQESCELSGYYLFVLIRERTLIAGELS